MYVDEAPMTFARGIAIVMSLVILCVAVYYAAQDGLPKPEGQVPAAAPSESVATAPPRSQWPHPEQKPDEVFVGNVSIGSFAQSSWKMKRLGTIRYGGGGKIVDRVTAAERDKAVADALAHPERYARHRPFWKPGQPYTTTFSEDVWPQENGNPLAHRSLPLFVKKEEVVADGLDPARFQSFVTKPEDPGK